MALELRLSGRGMVKRVVATACSLKNSSIENCCWSLDSAWRAFLKDLMVPMKLWFALSSAFFSSLFCFFLSFFFSCLENVTCRHPFQLNSLNEFLLTLWHLLQLSQMKLLGDGTRWFDPRRQFYLRSSDPRKGKERGGSWAGGWQWMKRKSQVHLCMFIDDMLCASDQDFFLKQDLQMVQVSFFYLFFDSSDISHVHSSGMEELLQDSQSQ